MRRFVITGERNEAPRRVGVGMHQHTKLRKQVEQRREQRIGQRTDDRRQSRLKQHAAENVQAHRRECEADRSNDVKRAADRKKSQQCRAFREQRRVQKMKWRAAILERVPERIVIAEHARDGGVDESVVPGLTGKIRDRPGAEQCERARKQTGGDRDVAALRQAAYFLTFVMRC